MLGARGKVNKIVTLMKRLIGQRQVNGNKAKVLNATLGRKCCLVKQIENVIEHAICYDISHIMKSESNL